jgi:hypothetical protein
MTEDEYEGGCDVLEAFFDMGEYYEDEEDEPEMDACSPHFRGTNEPFRSRRRHLVPKLPRPVPTSYLAIRATE